MGKTERPEAGKSRKLHEKAPPAKREPEREDEVVRRRRFPLPGERRRCFECGEVGHLAWDCPGREESMPTAASADGSPGKPCHMLTSYGGAECSPPHMVPVKVNGKDAGALVDSGSAVSLVHSNLLDQLEPNETVPVTCVHGDTKKYPVGKVQLTTTQGTCELKVGSVPRLPVPVLVGRDCPLYDKLYRKREVSGKKLKKIKKA